MDIRICIDVDDLERAIAFYTGGLGLRVGRRLTAGWAELLGAPCPIDLLAVDGRDFHRHWTPVHLDFVVTDIDAAAQRLVAHGATLEKPIAQRVWGRMASMADPFGHGIDLIQLEGRGYDAIVDAGGE